MSDSKPDFVKTKKFYTMVCHECGSVATKTVTLVGAPTHICEECEVRWNAGERDNCVECGKPLGSSTAICHGCFTDD